MKDSGDYYASVIKAIHVVDNREADDSNRLPNYTGNIIKHLADNGIPTPMNNTDPIGCPFDEDTQGNGKEHYKAVAAWKELPTTISTNVGIGKGIKLN